MDSIEENAKQSSQEGAPPNQLPLRNSRICHSNIQSNCWRTLGTAHKELIFCSADGLKALEMSSYRVCNETFKVAPCSAYQLYAIHTCLSTDRSVTFALAIFSLMAKKSKDAYEDLFLTFREALPHDHLGPLFISSDFEQAAILALQNIFPNASTVSCLFHLAQILYQKLQASGLQRAYNKESMTLRDDFHHIIALAFILPEDVPDTCDDLCKTADDQLQPVLQWMNNYYVHGQTIGKRKIPPSFPVNIWNCHDRVLTGLPHTTNTCEAWYSKHSRLLHSTSPSLFHFLDDMMLEKADARQAWVACAVGQSPPKCHRAYSCLDKQAECIVQSYDAYKTAKKINDYLKALGLAFAGNITADTQHADDDNDSDDADVDPTLMMLMLMPPLFNAIAKKGEKITWPLQVCAMLPRGLLEMRSWQLLTSSKCLFISGQNMAPVAFIGSSTVAKHVILSLPSTLFTGTAISL